MGCPLVVHYWADLQSVDGFRCYDNMHVCKLIALCTANAYTAEREMLACACTSSMAGCAWKPNHKLEAIGRVGLHCIPPPRHVEICTVLLMV